MNKAFTLAEVLITLGIIGVVAALTLPNIVGYYKRKESSVRIKKFYSIMEQAIRLSEIDNAEIYHTTQKKNILAMEILHQNYE